MKVNIQYLPVSPRKNHREIPNIKGPNLPTYFRGGWFLHQNSKLLYHHSTNVYKLEVTKEMK